MVTRELLELAVSRWPEEVQDEMRAAWLAELHVLHGEGRRWEALRFAFSLAASRPAKSNVVISQPIARTPRLETVAVLMLTPLACVALMLIAMIMASLFFDATPTERPVERSLLAGISALIAWWAWQRGRDSAIPGPLRVSAAVLAPIGLTALSVNIIAPYGGHEPDVAITRWLAGMLVVLWLAALLASRGRRATAWLAGVGGAFITAQVVVILTVVDRVPPAGVIWPSPFGYAPGVSLDTALAWLPMTLIERPLGSTTYQQAAMVIDAAGMVPLLMLMFTPYALAYAISAGHHHFLRLKTETSRSNSDPNGLSVTR